MEHRREFIENLQYGKQIDDFLDINNDQKRPRAPKPILLGLESEKSENHIIFLFFLVVENIAYWYWLLAPVFPVWKDSTCLSGVGSIGPIELPTIDHGLWTMDYGPI